MIPNRPPKEVCEGCTQFINIGQATTECQKCAKIIHTKCFKKTNFGIVNSVHYCHACHAATPPKYNPFKIINSHTDNDGDHFYNEEITDTIGPLADASEVLEQCKSYQSFEIRTLLTTASGDFTSLFYNIDGNKTNFDGFAAELKTLGHDFSIIGLAETNTDPEHCNLYPLDGYRCFYNPVVEGKTSGTGVALYVKNTFNAIVLDQLCTTKDSIEALFVKILFNNTEIKVGVVYRSPSYSHTEFLEAYTNIVDQISSDKFVQILGDFNTDLHKPHDNETQQFEEHFLSEGLFPTISLQTHKKDNTKGSCIDNIFTFNIQNIQHSGTISDMGKDHSPIFTISQLNLNLNTNNQNKEKQKLLYNYSNENIERFVDCLLSKSDESMGIDSPSPDFSKFIETFTEAIDEFCKLDTPRITKRTFSNNPWITEGIIHAVLHKAKLYKDWKTSCNDKLPDGNPRLYENFSSYRKCLKGVIGLAKEKFYKNKIAEHSSDHKKTWEIINQMRGNTKGATKPPFVINNERIFERRIIAQEFNNYFVSIASNMNQCISNLGEVAVQPLQSFQQFLPKSNPKSMFLFECTTDEVSKIISELQNGKSSDIPIKIIKRTNSIISPILACHFNHLMKIGKFPDELKVGKTTPIYKKDDAELLENYRPISTLPIFGKIFEKIIYSRLYGFFVSQNLLHDKQFGFRQNHSTSHAINYSVHHITQALKNNDHVLGIFIDLSKAFDTIDHKTLLSKLNTYGVRGTPHSLIKSYLSGRKQYVSVLGENSDLKEIDYGVPQGRCLGALLFLIYISMTCATPAKMANLFFLQMTQISLSKPKLHP